MTHATTNTLKTAFTFFAPSRVYCPECAAAITPRTCSIRDDVVWCLRCAEHRPTCHDWISFAISSTGLAIQWYTVRGLRFWCPDDPLDGIVTHYCKWRERLERSLPPAVFDGAPAGADPA